MRFTIFFILIILGVNQKAEHLKINLSELLDRKIVNTSIPEKHKLNVPKKKPQVSNDLQKQEIIVEDRNLYQNLVKENFIKEGFFKKTDKEVKIKEQPPVIQPPRNNVKKVVIRLIFKIKKPSDLWEEKE